MGFTFLFMFVLVEELDSSADPEDFLDVEVKDEPMENDAVSCDLFYHINLMFILLHYLILLQDNVYDSYFFYEFKILFIL